MQLSLPEYVAAFFERQGLERAAGVVALSGGPDSVALAWMLTSLLRQGRIPGLTLAHVNHQLRGPDSDADEAFVLKLARDWQLPCRTTRIDVRAEALARGDNLENTARCLRYDWLAQIAREEGTAWIATGHNADDQAETVLFRLLRGSGLQGLGGIRPRRPLAPGIDVVRPLLPMPRAQIMRFLEEHKLAYRADRSNEDLTFTRNRLRHELMPLLTARYNPALVEVLGRLAEQAQEVQAEVHKEASAILETIELPRAGDLLVLPIAGLMELSPFWRREVFRLVWAREQWPQGEMNFADWQRLADLAEGGAGALDLPAGIRARHLSKVIQVGPAQTTPRPCGSSAAG
jgi:tRNA(Ile)-lysidine synthase